MPQLDYVLLTGDFVAHDIWQNNWTEIRSETATVTSALRKALPASVRDKVFFVLVRNATASLDLFDTRTFLYRAITT